MQVNQLCFQHEKNAPYFFKDLSFELAANQIHVLHGKNGIGKTVLLNLLSGKIPPKAIIKGEINGGNRVVLVNQRFDSMIADQFSFEENLRFACMNRFPHPFCGLNSPHFYPEFLDKFHIDPSKPVHQLSGGQRQILALSMVLQKPMNILLLDEPTATLDEQNAMLVFEFLISLVQNGVTVLVVCHDRELVHRYATGSQMQLEIDPYGSGMRKLCIKTMEKQDKWDR